MYYNLVRRVGLSENISKDILEELFHYVPQETQYDISTDTLMNYLIISLKIYEE